MQDLSNERFRIDRYVDDSGLLATMKADVVEGLSASVKHLPPKYFYDDIGSALFEKITSLREYYPTRSEQKLLAETAQGLMAFIRPNQIIELGSGSSTKTRMFLGVSDAQEYLQEYIPFDVSDGIVLSSSYKLLSDFSFLSIHGIIGDFTTDIGKIPPAIGTRLLLFLGGTIGNLYPKERRAFLTAVAQIMSPNDYILIGVDLVKDTAIIEAAYNDSMGITAAFNRNILDVVNRAMSANFQPVNFIHKAFFNEGESRIEMHLLSKNAHDVNLKAVDLQIKIGKNETIWTESSYKFTETSIQQMLADGGLELDQLYSNHEANRLFGLVLAHKIER